MFRISVILILFMSPLLFAGAADDLNELIDDYIDYRAAYYPVWATGVGIHDYDSLLTDYTYDGIFKYRNDLAILQQNLNDIDIKKLEGDDLINYKLLKSDILTDEFFLLKHPAYANSPTIYIQEPIDGIYFLLKDNTRTIAEKAPLIFERMKRTKEFMDYRWVYQEEFAPIHYDAAVDMIDGCIELIQEASDLLMEAMPDSTRRISRVTQYLIRDYKNYKTYCQIEKKSVRGTHVIGKEDLNYLLRECYLLDTDSDSLKRIGWTWLEKSNLVLDSLNTIISAEKNSKSDPVEVNENLTKQDILDYYQMEIDETARFIKEHDLVTIPEKIGKCIPIETPEYLRPMHKGIAYMPAPAFSNDQTGYFFTRPISDLTADAKRKYSAMIQNRTFKSSVVHEAYPGHHLQFSLAHMNDNPLRKVQDNMMLSEGWALYCEQMMTEQGFFEGDDLAKRWKGVWGGIRYRAVRIIVDISLAEGTMTPDSALVFMNDKLGENTEYFTAEILRYCAYPTIALTYLTGKLQILDMLEKARKKEGKSFSLKEFHDKILNEGSIPPALIAEKYDYK